MYHIFDTIQNLYQTPSNDGDHTAVLTQFLSSIEQPIDIIQFIDNKPLILPYDTAKNHVYSYDIACDIGSNSSDRLDGAEPTYTPHHDYFASVIKNHGENGLDLAIIATEYAKADCLEVTKLLVRDGGIIIVTGVETWHPSQKASGIRDVHEMIASFQEYYYIDRHSCAVIVNRKGSAAHREVPHIGAKHRLLGKTFNALHHRGVLFIVLRSADFIPANCSNGKDIDIIIHPDDLDKAIDVFSQLGYRHYRDSDTHTPQLYNSKPNFHFLMPSHDLHIDAAQGLFYSSLNNSEKVPVHKHLQNSMFDRRRYVPDIWKCIPDISDIFIHVLCREIFDKKKITPLYYELLMRLFKYLDKTTIEKELEEVFFLFTPVLINHFANQCPSDLFTKYIKFSDY